MSYKPGILGTTLNEIDAAKYIGMSRSWLRQSRYLKFHHAPPYIRLGYTIRYKIEDLDAWKAEYPSSARDRYRRKSQRQSNLSSKS